MTSASPPPGSVPPDAHVVDDIETSDPSRAEVPPAPAEVPGGTAPPVRSLEGTTETKPPVDGVRRPQPDDPE